eukprot:TRINITY_DN8594_c0_g1_i4.p2 TRINITY_DN8594_c0_g1~~TRINITY_DN8594_c0_g1_i4.p2  ORF type:complete len:148 (-),score=7.17 TRINITY_DN8594_c0_g1_i4:688-1131(-)
MLLLNASPRSDGCELAFSLACVRSTGIRHAYGKRGTSDAFGLTQIQARALGPITVQGASPLLSVYCVARVYRPTLVVDSSAQRRMATTPRWESLRMRACSTTCRGVVVNAAQAWSALRPKSRARFATSCGERRQRPSSSYMCTSFSV